MPLSTHHDPRAGALTRPGRVVVIEAGRKWPAERGAPRAWLNSGNQTSTGRERWSARTDRCGLLASRRCAIADKGADLHSKENEAQALTIDEIEDQIPGTRLKWATVRNGDVTEVGHIEAPDEYYRAATGSAIECLMAARNVALHEKPRIKANAIVELLASDGLISRDDARFAVAVIEVNLRKQIEEFYELSRQELSGRFPLLLRTLIPLIRRSIRRS